MPKRKKRKSLTRIVVSSLGWGMTDALFQATASMMETTANEVGFAITGETSKRNRRK